MVWAEPMVYTEQGLISQVKPPFETYQSAPGIYLVLGIMGKARTGKSAMISKIG